MQKQIMSLQGHVSQQQLQLRTQERVTYEKMQDVRNQSSLRPNNINISVLFCEEILWTYYEVNSKTFTNR
jgi:hypothetical protein